MNGRGLSDRRRGVRRRERNTWGWGRKRGGGVSERWREREGSWERCIENSQEKVKDTKVIAKSPTCSAVSVVTHSEIPQRYVNSFVSVVYREYFTLEYFNPL